MSDSANYRLYKVNLYKDDFDQAPINLIGD